MRERLKSPLAMWRVLHQLNGGHRRMVAVGAVYAVVLGFGTYALHWVLRNEVSTEEFAGGALNFVSALQLLIVLVGGCNAVHRGLLRDYETKMIESHRLTPMSNLTVVAGYVFGGSCQILLLFLINATLGLLLCALAGYGPRNWLWGNALVLSLGIFLWTGTVFAGIRQGKPINPTGIVVLIGMLTMPLLLLPGAGLMLGVYGAYMAISVLYNLYEISAPEAALMVGLTLFLTGFWATAAAARYRRPDLPALNAFRGLLMLFFWLLFSSIGIVGFSAFTQNTMRNAFDPSMMRGQWIATLVTSLLVACVPISSTALCHLLVRRGSSPRDWVDRVPDLPVVLLAVLLICLIPGITGWTIWTQLLDPEQGTGRTALAWLYTAMACLLALITARGVYVMAYVRGRGPASPTVLLALLWIFPPILDVLRSLTFDHMEYVESWLMGCSPAGTLLIIWSDNGAGLWESLLLPGLAFQLLLVLFFTLVAGRRKRQYLQRGGARPLSVAPAIAH